MHRAVIFLAGYPGRRPTMTSSPLDTYWIASQLVDQLVAAGIATGGHVEHHVGSAFGWVIADRPTGEPIPA